MKSPLKEILFIVLVIAQLGTLGWMVVDRNRLAVEGEKILLECEPVDPRSLLSGDYVILNYRISSFDDKELDQLVRGEKKFRKSAPLWVVLKEGKNGFHEATDISRDRPDLEDGETVIRGAVQSYYRGGRLRIRYGLEQFFVPQKEGKVIERQIRDTSVEVAVNEDGDSAVVRIFIAGEEVKFH